MVTLFVLLLMAEFAIRTIDAVRGDGFFASPRNEIASSERIGLPFRTFGVDSYREVNGRRFISSRYQELYPVHCQSPHVIESALPGFFTHQFDPASPISGSTLQRQQACCQRLFRQSARGSRVGFPPSQPSQ